MRKNLKIKPDTHKQLAIFAIQQEIDIQDLADILIKFAIKQAKKNPTILTTEYAQNLIKDSKD